MSGQTAQALSPCTTVGLVMTGYQSYPFLFPTLNSSFLPRSWAWGVSRARCGRRPSSPSWPRCGRRPATSTSKSSSGGRHSHRFVYKDYCSVLVYWADQKNLVKGCCQRLNFICVSCEMLSASIADALLFVNILVSGIFHGRFAQQLAVNKPCLQIIRHLLWNQTTTHSLRNNNPMFDSNLLLNLYVRLSTYCWWLPDLLPDLTSEGVGIITPYIPHIYPIYTP